MPQDLGFPITPTHARTHTPSSTPNSANVAPRAHRAPRAASSGSNSYPKTRALAAAGPAKQKTAARREKRASFVLLASCVGYRLHMAYHSDGCRCTIPPRPRQLLSWPGCGQSLTLRDLAASAQTELLSAPATAEVLNEEATPQMRAKKSQHNPLRAPGGWVRTPARPPPAAVGASPSLPGPSPLASPPNSPAAAGAAPPTPPTVAPSAPPTARALPPDPPFLGVLGFEGGGMNISIGEISLIAVTAATKHAILFGVQRVGPTHSPTPRITAAAESLFEQLNAASVKFLASLLK